MILKSFNKLSHKKRKAQQFVEFLIVAPVLLLMLVAIIEFGYTVTIKNMIANEVSNVVFKVMNGPISTASHVPPADRVAMIKNYIKSNMTVFMLQSNIPFDADSFKVDIITTTDKAYVSVSYYYKPALLSAILPLIPNKNGTPDNNKPVFNLNTTQVIDLSLIKWNRFDDPITTKNLSNMFHSDTAEAIASSQLSLSNTNNFPLSTAFLVAYFTDNASLRGPILARLYSYEGNDLLPGNLMVNVTTGTLVLTSDQPYYNMTENWWGLDTKIPYIWVLSALGYSNVFYTQYNAVYGNDSDIAWEWQAAVETPPLYMINMSAAADYTGTPDNAYNFTYPYSASSYRVNPKAFDFSTGELAPYYSEYVNAVRACRTLDDFCGANVCNVNDVELLFPSCTDAECTWAVQYMIDYRQWAHMVNNLTGCPPDCNDDFIYPVDFQAYMNAVPWVDSLPAVFFSRSLGYRWDAGLDVTPTRQAPIFYSLSRGGGNTIQELALKHTARVGLRNRGSGYNGGAGWKILGNNENLRLAGTFTMSGQQYGRGDNIVGYNDYLKHYTPCMPDRVYNAGHWGVTPYQTMNIYQPVVAFYSTDPTGYAEDIDASKLCDPNGPFYEQSKWQMNINPDSGQYDPTGTKAITIADVYMDSDGDEIPDAWDDHNGYFDVDGDGHLDGEGSSFWNSSVCAEIGLQGNHRLYDCNLNAFPLEIDRFITRPYDKYGYNNVAYGVLPYINPPFICKSDAPDPVSANPADICYLRGYNTDYPMDKLPANVQFPQFVSSIENGGALYYLVVKNDGDIDATRALKTWSADPATKAMQQTFYSNYTSRHFVSGAPTTDAYMLMNADWWMHMGHHHGYFYNPILGVPEPVYYVNPPNYWIDANTGQQKTFVSPDPYFQWTVYRIGNTIPNWTEHFEMPP